MSSTVEKASVLIVEDNPIIAFDIQDCLAQQGYKIAGIANNANAAYDLLKGGKVEIAMDKFIRVRVIKVYGNVYYESKAIGDNLEFK